MALSCDATDDTRLAILRRDGVPAPSLGEWGPLSGKDDVEIRGLLGEVG